MILATAATWWTKRHLLLIYMQAQNTWETDGANKSDPVTGVNMVFV